MDGRGAFLTMAREEHNQGQAYTCNNSKSHVKTRYHCTICNDFDLCISCEEKDGRRHHIEKLGLDLDAGSSPADAKQANSQEVRKLSVQRCIQSLVHSRQCRDADCQLPNCQKMKRAVTHTKVCKRKTNGGCPICKQLIALCAYHAMHCQETKICLVPFCSDIKLRLKQQRLQQQQQHQGPPGMGVGGQMPRQPGVIGGPVGQVGQAQGVSRTIIRHAWQLIETLRSPHTLEQEDQVLHILRSNPLLMAAFIELRSVMTVDIARGERIAFDRGSQARRARAPGQR